MCHISEVEQGLACSCVCVECGLPLVARKGPIRQHHFAHAGETNCNPSPENLTHRYAKELIGARLRAIEPAFEVRVAAAGVEAWARQPALVFEAQKAEVESLAFMPDFKPDVLLHKGACKLAVEVYFRHQVAVEKLERITRRYAHAVEVDLGDLPPNARPEEISKALDTPRRWKWLNNGSELFGKLQQQVDRCSKLYIPRLTDLASRKTPTSYSIQLPRQKVQEGQGKVGWAEEWRQLPSETRKRYTEMTPAEKLAIHCSYLGLTPVELPLNLMQGVRGQSLLGRVHGLYWQTWMFARFGVGVKTFGALDVERAARQTYPELGSVRATLQTANGFSETGELFYEFMLQLAAQGLLEQHAGHRPWLNSFSPVVRSRIEVGALLRARPPAIPG
jgi:hypothetical protein